MSGRKRLALVGALTAFLLAGAIVIALTIGGEDDAQSSREQGTDRTGGERPTGKRGDDADARNGAEGSSQRGSERAPRRSNGGGSRRGGSDVAPKLPKDLVRELRRRKIPVIELEPGQGPGGVRSGERLDPRTLRKFLEQK